MTLVPLKTSKGKTVGINPDHVISVQEVVLSDGSRGACIMMVGGLQIPVAKSVTETCIVLMMADDPETILWISGSDANEMQAVDYLHASEEEP